MAKTDVLFIIDAWVLGGAASYLRHLCRCLMKKGMRVSVLSLGGKPEAETVEIPFHYFDAKNIGFYDRIGEILKRVDQCDPEIVVSWSAHATCEALRYVKRKKIAVQHGSTRNRLKLLLPYVPYLDSVVCVSAYIAKQVQSMVGENDRSRICYVPSGVVTEDSPPKALSVPIQIAYAGRLIEEDKRVNILPDIYDSLVSSGMDFQFHIAGDGPERNSLEKRMGVGARAEFHGRLDDRALRVLYARSHYILLPSSNEGMPLVILEAMSYGAVPVAYAIKSGVPEIVTDETGILVMRHTGKAYADSIIGLSSKPEKFKQLSNNAKALILARHSAEVSTDAWAVFFNRLVPCGIASSCEKIHPPLTHPYPIIHMWPFRSVIQWVKKQKSGIKFF